MCTSAILALHTHIYQSQNKFVSIRVSFTVFFGNSCLYITVSALDSRHKINSVNCSFFLPYTADEYFNVKDDKLC